MQWKQKITGCFLIPQRYILGIMGFLAMVNAYTMRVSLSIAITEMVKHSNTTAIYDSDSCPAGDGDHSTEPITNSDHLYEWDETQQGLILSAFYWGYVITHIPGGILAEKFGGRYTLGLGIFSTSLLTLITPAVIYACDGNWVILVVLRVIEGLGEGCTYPALNVLLAKWVPINDRGKMGASVYAGGQIGTIISSSISGALIASTQNWASVFYLFGGIGLLWVVVWFLLCYSEPQSHPFISDKELKFLQNELTNVSSEKKAIPWKAILTLVPVWAMVVAQIGHDWGFYTIVTDLPKYMKDVLKFRVDENGLWSSLPYAVMWIVSMLSGWLSDWLVENKHTSIGFARKLFTAVAAVGPGIFIIAASYVGCDRMTAVYMFTIGMGLMGPYYCGLKVNALDLSPNFAGTLMAITSGIGSIAGIITPYLTGAIAQNQTLLEWRTVLWISFAIFMSTSVVYVVFASGEEQWWNDVEKHRRRSDEEAEKKVDQKELNIM